MPKERKNKGLITAECVFKKRPCVTFSELPDGSGVLLNLENKYFYTLNETASKILNSIDGKNSLSDISAIMLKEYDTSPEELSRNISSLIKGFIKEGVVEAVK